MNIKNIPNLDFCLYIDENERGDEFLWVHHKPTGYSVSIREDCIKLDSIKDAMATLMINQRIVNA